MRNEFGLSSVARATNWAILHTVGSGAAFNSAVNSIRAINSIAERKGFEGLAHNNWVP
jgi:hypothetical protein